MGVRHEVLNAKNHEREAFIVAQAGRKGAVTVSTNMAGRGTDILLGGNPEFTGQGASAQGEQRSRRTCRPARWARRSAQEWDAVYGRFKAEMAEGSRRSGRARRPAHRRHGAPRIAPHRQSASRTRRTPGRPRQRALLPLAARRPDAHLRRPAHAEPDAAAGHGRRRADREQDDHASASPPRRRPSRRRTSPRANTSSNTTT